MKQVLAIWMCIVWSGCTAVSTQPRPDEYFDSSSAASQTGVTSLFAGDASVLSDEEIRRILEYRYTPTVRAQLSAIGSAMDEISQQIVGFLESGAGNDDR